MNSTVGQGLPRTVAASGAIEAISRLGYAMHGAVYLVIGILAAKLAWGAGGALADPPSVIQLIGKQPMGKVLISLIGLGLTAYAFWRFIQAVADPDHQGKNLKGVIVRSGRFISGLGYSALSLFALRLVSGTNQVGEPEGNWAVRLLTEPVGALLGGIVALILLGVACDDLRKACTTNFGERFKRHGMSQEAIVAGRYAGSWGFAAAP